MRQLKCFSYFIHIIVSLMKVEAMLVKFYVLMIFYFVTDKVLEAATDNECTDVVNKHTQMCQIPETKEYACKLAKFKNYVKQKIGCHSPYVCTAVEFCIVQNVSEYINLGTLANYTCEIDNFTTTCRWGNDTFTRTCMMSIIQCDSLNCDSEAGFLDVFRGNVVIHHPVHYYKLCLIGTVFSYIANVTRI